MAPDKGIAEGEATGVGLLTCEPHQGRPPVAGPGLSTQRRKQAQRAKMVVCAKRPSDSTLATWPHARECLSSVTRSFCPVSCLPPGLSSPHGRHLPLAHIPGLRWPQHSHESWEHCVQSGRGHTLTPEQPCSGQGTQQKGKVAWGCASRGPCGSL